MEGFNDKVAAITGAGSGIGQQLALALAKRGCHLALSDINAEALKATQELLSGSEVTVSTRILDVSDKAAMHDWAESVVQEHGKVNMIFNNAGVCMASTIEGSSYEDYEWIIGINLWGVIYGTKEFLPHIKATQDGCVINVSSLFGLTAQPAYSGYNTTKFAVRGFTESLIQELDILDCGVHALSVHPGGIKTNIAVASRIKDSIQTLGLNPKTTVQRATKRLKTSPEDTAEKIIEAVLQKKRRVLIGNDAVILDKIQRMMPTGYQKLITNMARKAANE